MNNITVSLNQEMSVVLCFFYLFILIAFWFSSRNIKREKYWKEEGLHNTLFFELIVFVATICIFLPLSSFLSIISFIIFRDRIITGQIPEDAMVFIKEIIIGITFLLAIFLTLKFSESTEPEVLTE